MSWVTSAALVFDKVPFQTQVWFKTGQILANSSDSNRSHRWAVGGIELGRSSVGGDQLRWKRMNLSSSSQ